MPNRNTQPQRPLKSSTPEFFSPQQVAPILGLHARTVIRRCEDGTIPAEKYGVKWRIPRSSLDRVGSDK